MGIEIRLRGSAEAFSGPLDLLLALVRSNRYPLDRLPIAEITRQYSAYIKEARDADVELGGEFVETASWLVLLKSRTLLPSAETPEGNKSESPEQELRRVLLDHATLKETAALLRERMEQTGLGSGGDFRRSAGAPPEDFPVLSPPLPTVQDAVLAARRALEAVRARAPAPEIYPVEAEVCWILAEIASIARDQTRSTEPWFAARPDAEARVALFLALLELARLSRILLGQPHRFGPIYLKRAASEQ